MPPFSPAHLIVLLSALAHAQQPVAVKGASGAVPAPAAVSVPSCSNLSSVVDGVVSTGPVKVPVTIDAANPYKDLEAIKAINRGFTPDQVEKNVLDPKVDMPSAARLLSEFRCWGTWRRQHDFYRRVLRDQGCGYLRHRAVQLLEYDLCTPETVTALVSEYEHTVYPETRELIIRKLGMSRDKRATALVEEAIRSTNKALAKAAAEGKSYGASQSCVPQDSSGKPYYGYMDVADVCEGTSDGAGIVANTGAQPQGAEQPGSGPKGKNAGPKPGGADDVSFGF